MKKLKIFPVTAAVIALLMFILPMSAFATGNNVKVQPIGTHFIFDGNQVKPPAGRFSFSYQNTTYVPLRFVSYALQKNVNWDGKLKKVTVSDPTPNQLVSLKESIMNSQAMKDTSIPSNKISIEQMKVNFVFNGVKKDLPAGQLSFIYKGTLYVPIRFVAESTGSSVTWDQKTKTVIGKSKAYSDNEKTTGTTTNDNTKPGSDKPSTSPESKPSTGGGTNTGVTPGKSSYDNITDATQAKLEALRAESKAVLFDLAKDYLSATDDTAKKKLLAEGQNKLNGFTATFESIVKDTEAQLKANGYSTEIINEYRKTFNDEIEAGKKLAEELA